MANSKKPNEKSIANLKPAGKAHKLTDEDRKKGRKKAAENLKRKKELKECLEILLEAEIEKDGIKLSGAEAICQTLFKTALSGGRDSLEAFKIIRDSSGQKPSDKIEIATFDKNIVDEIEEMFNSVEDE